nr:retrotransposon Gag domain-containing protein [Tanacetum cinerariifolium]
MPNRRRDLRKRLGSKHIRSTSGSPEPRCGRSESPRKKGPERKTVRWLQIVNGRSHFQRGNSRMLDKSITSRKEASATNKGWNESRTLLMKSKVILALDKGKFKPPLPMTTLVEKKNAIKFCEFHREVGHTTDECMHLKKKIEEMLRVGKLSHLIKELKQSNGKDQAKAAKKGGNPRKGQAAGNLDGTAMAEGKEDGAEGPMIIKAEMGGHLFTACMWTGAPLYKSCMNTIDSAQRKARSKENPVSSVYNSRNAKIPSDRRNGHIAEQ